jgi:CRISPR-associated protein Cmr6
MIEGRRNILPSSVGISESHAGLLLDKYLAAYLVRGESPQKGKQTPQQELVDQVSRIAEPSYYRSFFKRWKQALSGCGAHSREATVLGRMVIGLGDESVLETSVTLHRTYGVPYIPGSALKGLTASYARQHLGDAWKKDEIYYKIALGSPDEAGYITFFDALYIPGTGVPNKDQPLAPDIITVHHPDYYQRSNPKPAADWDSPTPVPFLSATGTYLVALAGQPDWVKAVFDILSFALRDMGIGAKTSSGYGRMTLKETPPDPHKLSVDRLVTRIDSLPDSQVANQISQFYNEWKSLQISDALKREVAQAIIAKVKKVGREKASREKAWYKELLASIDGS